MGKNKQNTTEELTKFEKKWLRAEGNPHLVRLPSYSLGNFPPRRMVQGLTKWILTRLELRPLDRELSALTTGTPTALIIHYSPLSSPFVTVWRAVLLFLPTPVFFWICCLRLWWITRGRWRRRRRGGRGRRGRVGLDTSGFINMHTVCYLCYLRSFFLYKNTMNHISTLGGGGGGGGRGADLSKHPSKHPSPEEGSQADHRRIHLPFPLSRVRITNLARVECEQKAQERKIKGKRGF